MNDTPEPDDTEGTDRAEPFDPQTAAVAGFWQQRRDVVVA